MTIEYLAPDGKWTWYKNQAEIATGIIETGKQNRDKTWDIVMEPSFKASKIKIHVKKGDHSLRYEWWIKESSPQPPQQEI